VELGAWHMPLLDNLTGSFVSEMAVTEKVNKRSINSFFTSATKSKKSYQPLKLFGILIIIIALLNID